MQSIPHPQQLFPYSQPQPFDTRIQQHPQTHHQPPPRQLSFTPFAIPTKDDSLSSSFPYSPLLQPLSIPPPLWAEFTYSLDTAAKLTFSDNKKAWGAGLASGTAGTFALLFLGPIAGYYTGKAIHKKTVIEKVKERLLEDGSIYNVLREWNDVRSGDFGRRGVQVELEFPAADGEEKGKADAKRFRILVRPGQRFMVPLPVGMNQGRTFQKPELAGVEVGGVQNGDDGEQVGQQPSRRYDVQVAQGQQAQNQLQRQDSIVMSGGLGPAEQPGMGVQQLDSRQIMPHTEQLDENEPEAPPLPARPPHVPPKVPLLDSNPIHEAPNMNAVQATMSVGEVRNKHGEQVYELDGHGDLWDMEDRR